MKKAFTPKMKFRLDSDCSDGYWCKPVGPEIKHQIDQYFEEHPKDYERFCALPCSPRPTISSAWLNMTEEEAKRFETAIEAWPEVFTQEESMKLFEANGLAHCFGKPPANYIFYCNTRPWELNENFDPIFRNPKLEKFKEK